jgi:hypothetical protein
MASGDDIQAGRITAAEETTHLIAQIPTGDHPPPFDGDIILEVSPQQAGVTKPEQTLNAILGKGGNGPIPSPGGTGVTGIGGPNQGTGVIGRGGGDDQGQGGIGVIAKGGSVLLPVNPGEGVFAQGGHQDDVFNVTNQPHAAGVVGVAGGTPPPTFAVTGGVGVFGQGGNADRKSVTADGKPAVSGPAAPGPGVLGRGATQSLDGAVQPGPSAGVIGLAGDAGFPPFDEVANTGVYGKGTNGVIGVGGGDIGVALANALDSRIGVVGASLARTGETKPAIGVVAFNADFSGREPIDMPALYALSVKLEGGQTIKGLAGLFDGDIRVTGVKGAVVPHPDGSHRLLSAIESPESWFEDFGEGQLKDGKVKIQLDPDFAKVVKTDKYHVFVTSYRDSHGLYVTNRTNKGFEVREQRGGKSSLTFSYRIVARRKDIEGKRLAKVTLPPLPSLAQERKPSTRKSKQPLKKSRRAGGR